MINRELKTLIDKRRIIASYKLHDTDDISTERLLQIVADDCNCEISDVVEALRGDTDEAY